LPEALATVTSKGQITIPVEVRRHLGLKAHDRVAFVVEDDGGVRLVVPRYPTIRSLRGAAGSLGRTLSWDEMRRMAREDFVESDSESA
jgi:antitoxin PrlF